MGLLLTVTGVVGSKTYHMILTDQKPVKAKIMSEEHAYGLASPLCSRSLLTSRISTGMISMSTYCLRRRKMRRLLIGLIAVTLLAGSIQAVYAEEDLFDTKAAAEHLEKGIAHLKAKNYGAAVTELEESVSIAPDAEAYYYLGYTYYMKGRSGDSESRKKSIESFDKAYELTPGFAPNRYRPAETVASQAQAAQKSSGREEASPSVLSHDDPSQQPLQPDEPTERKSE